MRWLLLMLGLSGAEPDAAERDYVLRLLAKAQAQSFRDGRERCGFVLRAPGGFAHTGPVAGTIDSCASDLPAGPVVASWHTHGGFLAHYHGELPSEADWDSDAGLGLHGWIATPGGRLWLVEPVRGLARQACGPGCLPVDPRFHEPGPIAKAYTAEGLRARLRDAP